MSEDGMLDKDASQDVVIENTSRPPQDSLDRSFDQQSYWVTLQSVVSARGTYEDAFPHTCPCGQRKKHGYSKESTAMNQVNRGRGSDRSIERRLFCEDSQSETQDCEPIPLSKNQIKGQDGKQPAPDIELEGYAIETLSKKGGIDRGKESNEIKPSFVHSHLPRQANDQNANQELGEVEGREIKEVVISEQSVVETNDEVDDWP
jgi:hypothetical protein